MRSVTHPSDALGSHASGLAHEVGTQKLPAKFCARDEDYTEIQVVLAKEQLVTEQSRTQDVPF